MLKIPLILAGLLVSSVSFAQTPSAATSANADIIPVVAAKSAPTDPLEPFNRTMFRFNQAVLSNVINPTADYLGPRLPAPVIAGLGNAYSNLTEIEFILNNLLTGAPLAAAIHPDRRLAAQAFLVLHRHPSAASPSKAGGNGNTGWGTPNGRSRWSVADPIAPPVMPERTRAVTKMTDGGRSQ